jgi:hypothetical protein
MEQMKRRGLLAAMVGLVAALVAKITSPEPNVAFAQNQTVDGNLLFTDPGQNQFRDIQLVNNDAGLRMYTAPSLTSSPAGAAIQFWGNASGLPGQAYIDSGANNGAAVFLRTAPSGGTITERFGIDANGNVTILGNLAVQGTKAFVIDHPLDPTNKYLYHSAVEAPEQLDVYRGRVTTDGAGTATVQLPTYFGALNKDVLYQLTVIGQMAQAIVSDEVQNNQFTIKTDKPNVQVSWQVSGVRNDPFARKIGFQAEQTKGDRERGYYLSPEAYSQPESKGIAWQRAPERVVGH